MLKCLIKQRHEFYLFFEHEMRKIIVKKEAHIFISTRRFISFPPRVSGAQVKQCVAAGGGFLRYGSTAPVHKSVFRCRQFRTCQCAFSFSAAWPARRPDAARAANTRTSMHYFLALQLIPREPKVSRILRCVIMRGRHERY